MEIKKSLKFLSIIFLTIIVLAIIAIHLHKLYTSNKQVKSNDIHIVYTTDLSYKDYTKVSIKSAIVNKNETSKYHINVLCVDLTEAQMKEFEALNTKDAEVKPILVQLSSVKDIGTYSINHYVSRADLFKFVMPDLFPNLDKILYLDSDTIIKTDLTTLYNTDVTNYYLAAVKRYDGVTWKHVISNLYWGRYQYNCGILVFNLKKWRENDITKKLIQAKNDDLIRRYMTQGAFNEVLPLRSVKQISPIYNALTRITQVDYLYWDIRRHYAPFLNDCKTADDFFRKAIILHYAGPVKPWYYTDSPQAEIWWHYAKMVNPLWNVKMLNN